MMTTKTDAIMYQVHFAGGSRLPISCKLASYRDALIWIREFWTTENGELATPVCIHPAAA